MARGGSICLLLVLAAVPGPAGCGGAGSGLTREQWLRELQNSLRSEVTSRDVNRENSRTVEQALDAGALKDLTRFEVRQALGRGEACAGYERCGELGFLSDDWIYTVGRGNEDEVGRRPLLIVGFGRQDRVIRTWNLRVH